MLIAGPDCRLNVVLAGDGDPVSVFAHGITSSLEEIRDLADAMPGTRVLFDFRGHGASDAPPPEAGYGHAAMRRDLEAVVTRFGATRALGVSMGAGAILAMLEADALCFERVVLLIPARLDAANPTGDVYPALAHVLETRPLEAVAEAALQAPEYEALFRVRPVWRDLVRERIMRMNATGVPRALRAYAAEGGPVADPERLRAVRAPALVLAHEGDPIHDAAVARRIAALLPNAELRMWPEPLAMFDDRAALAELIGGFLGASLSWRP